MRRMGSAALIVLLYLLVTSKAAGSSLNLQRVSPTAGFTYLDKKLYRTADNGQHWNEITPPYSPSSEISSAFFLNATVGWVVVSTYDDPADTNRFMIESTTDAGAHWLAASLRSDLVPAGISLGSYTSVSFVDRRHGWLSIELVSSAAAHFGIFLTSTDGGQTWTRVHNGPGTAGDVRFGSLLDGWIVSPEGDELTATHDGGNTWEKTELIAPGHANENATYELPTLTNARSGYLAVKYSGLEAETLVIFKTQDGGRTWNPIDSIDGQDEGSSYMAAFQSGVLLTRVSQGKATVTAVSPAGTAEGAKTVDLATIGDVTRLEAVSYADPRHVWILAYAPACTAENVCVYLLSSEDGGASWRDITPLEVRKVRELSLPSGVTVKTRVLKGPPGRPEPF